jgi:hypothetical protein
MCLCAYGNILRENLFSLARFSRCRVFGRFRSAPRCFRSIFKAVQEFSFIKRKLFCSLFWCVQKRKISRNCGKHNCKLKDDKFLSEEKRKPGLFRREKKGKIGKIFFLCFFVYIFTHTHTYKPYRQTVFVGRRIEEKSKEAKEKHKLCVQSFHFANKANNDTGHVTAALECGVIIVIQAGPVYFYGVLRPLLMTLNVYVVTY